MARTNDDFDYESTEDERLLLDLDDLDQDESDCLAILSVHNGSFGRPALDEY
ncbi:MAG: hypothetical protein RIM84_23650 [Alphaproteobacteria bacterium]